ncbi:MAG: transglutaminase-like domain-containing protein [Planctomycetota bacterium]|nr:tetratricopeptide repeat protein [Planctomycetaceae bacterium]MDQ3330814.1 transglutaminase-like domain-containing protein [Planctomycetota bacterium]
MAFDSEFRCDSEFVKLLTRRTDIDLVAASIEIARDTEPDLDAETLIAWIDERAYEVRGPVARAESEADALLELGRCINGRHGLTGGCSAFESADGSYLHRVIETRTGIPISLCVLYMAVAEKVGLELKGVAAPRHFLTRYESSAGPLFVDAYHGGRVLTLRECLKFLSGVTGRPGESIEPSLAPADGRSIIVRMLNNLKALYAKRGEWQKAWHVQHRLVALQPAAYEERRDLAVIALNAGRPGCAIDLLNSCLTCGPEAERAELKSHLRAAHSQLIRLN